MEELQPCPGPWAREKAEVGRIAAFAIQTINYHKAEGKPWLVVTRLLAGTLAFDVPYKALVIMPGSILLIRRCSLKNSEETHWS